MANPYCHYPHAPITRIRAQFRVEAAHHAYRKISGAYENTYTPHVQHREIWTCVRHLGIALDEMLAHSSHIIVHEPK